MLVLSLAFVSACGNDDSDGANGVEMGTYVRLADPSFESIEACEEEKEAAGSNILFNCAQFMTLREDGTFFRILTDIAESGTFTITSSMLVLTLDLDESTTEIPINGDGTLGDGWQLDREAGS